MLLEEADRYSTRYYETTTGLETWFAVPDLKTEVSSTQMENGHSSLVCPLYAISLISRSILNPSIVDWPLPANGIIFTAILVVGLTYFAMPVLSQLLRQ